MPEVMIIYRFYFEGIGLTDEWWDKFQSLSNEKIKIIKPIIHKNNFLDIEFYTSDSEILDVLSYYTIKHEDMNTALKNTRLQVRKFNEDLARRLIRIIKVNKGEKFEI